MANDEYTVDKPEFTSADIKMYDRDGNETTREKMQVKRGAVLQNQGQRREEINGKLTIEFSGAGQPFSPPPGRYKYILKTSYLLASGGNSQHKVWLYGDFIVEDVLPYDNNNDYGV